MTSTALRAILRKDVRENHEIQEGQAATTNRAAREQQTSPTPRDQDGREEREEETMIYGSLMKTEQ